MSTAVTRKPRCASCHVQPPGAAPRSTARMPACSELELAVAEKGDERFRELQRRARRRAAPASAAAGCPSASGCPTVAGSRRRRHARRRRRARAARNRSRSPSAIDRLIVAHALRQRLLERAAEPGQLLAVVGVGSLETERSEHECRASLRSAGSGKLGAQRVDQEGERRHAIGARPYCVRHRTVRAAPSPKNSARTKIGGTCASARGQRGAVERAAAWRRRSRAQRARRARPRPRRGGDAPRDRPRLPARSPRGSAR